MTTSGGEAGAARAVWPASRIIGIAGLALVLGLLVATQRIYFERWVIPGDAFTYLSAGERLNAGHLLYALSPGDRPVGLHPPFWTVPLVSPPPIAVVFRLFAVFGVRVVGHAPPVPLIRPIAARWLARSRRRASTVSTAMSAAMSAAT